MAFSPKQLKQMANAARSLSMLAIESAHSGHVGIALGAADIITTIYANHLRFNPERPDWSNRDRFVLSAGHGSALLYSVLKLSGYNIPDLTGFRSFGSPLAGHPEYTSLPGIEYSTGPLGQGLAGAVGMAMGAKMRRARKIGEEYRVFVLCSDGDLMEGISAEAAAVAGQYKLGNLIVFWDDNKISIDGTALTDINILQRFAAAGWNVISCDGNNATSIDSAIKRAKKSARPSFIKCKTILGFGSSVAGTAAAHGLALDNKELHNLYEKFKSDDGVDLWKTIPHQPIEYIKKHPNNEILNAKTSLLDAPSKGEISTRKASGLVLTELVKNNPDLLIGGSADLSESTCTETKYSKPITAKNFSGNFIHYGVREHAMAAIMNGLCLSGFRPYGGTFLVFSDYMRPSIRLSALMGLPVIYIFTHDSIAVGEDGPTHQPIEQLASLRTIPNLNVFRPADIREVAACWEIALSERTKPSAIILSRQTLPTIHGTDAEKVDHGGYVVSNPTDSKKIKITLVATGSEVSLAIKVQKKLAECKISAAVVSMPSVEIFRRQEKEYKAKTLRGTVIAIEAGSPYAWYEFADGVVGIETFGRCGTGADVYARFGFDAETIAGDILSSRPFTR